MMRLPAHVRSLLTADARPGNISTYEYRDHGKKNKPANPRGRGFRVDSGPEGPCAECGRRFYLRALDERGWCGECVLGEFFQAVTANMKGARP